MSKKKPIRAIFIDAVKEEVKDIVLQDGGQFRPEMFRLLSMPGLRPCDDIATVKIDRRRHFVHIDGEGLLKDPTHFFLWKGYGNPLPGHGIIHRIVGGGSEDAELYADDVREGIKFAKMQMHGFVERVEQREIFGRMGTAITRQSVITVRRAPGEGSAVDLDEIAEHMGLPKGTLKWTPLPGEDDETEPKEEIDEPKPE
jgi:hypothetical protein